MDHYGLDSRLKRFHGVCYQGGSWHKEGINPHLTPPPEKQGLEVTQKVLRLPFRCAEREEIGPLH